MRPSKALLEHGVSYIELRSIDNNIFLNSGIDLEQMYFIELLMIHSLIISDKEISENEYTEIKNNLTNVAHNGREKDFKLQLNNKDTPIKKTLDGIICELKKISNMMYLITHDKKYKDCIKKQEEKLSDRSNLPSNMVIDKMKIKEISFYEFCMENIWKQKKYFTNINIEEGIVKKLKDESLMSDERRVYMERNNQETYEDYIEKYFED